MTEVYNPKTFILHAASHRQTSVHCEWSSTAASRRSLGSISVPVRLAVLSDQLIVIALVGRYPTNKLMIYGLISMQEALRSPPLARWRCLHPPHSVLAPLSRSYPQHKGRLPILSSPFRHSHQQNHIATHLSDPVRLACLIHAASVRSEPESNSQSIKMREHLIAVLPRVRQTNLMLPGTSFSTVASLPGQSCPGYIWANLVFKDQVRFRLLPCGVEHRGAKTGHIVAQKPLSCKRFFEKN